MLGVIVYAVALRLFAPDFYYGSVQEDEYLEWGTFWLFNLAAGGFVWVAFQRRGEPVWPWFPLGVAAFCFVVAMEEISWGQRLFGIRPPDYFLAHNFQQELNVHNFVSTPMRKLLTQLLIAGYGITLPLLTLQGRAREWLAQLGVLAPSLGLAPGFAITSLFYFWYPLSYTGEWVEFMLALGFVLAAVLHCAERSALLRRTWRPLPAGVVALVAVWMLGTGLGVTHAGLYRLQRSAHPAILAAAELEIESLRADFAGSEDEYVCDFHRRLYRFVDRKGGDFLRVGAFTGLGAQGLPEERATFFLDPWNQPYWIRDDCGDETGERRVFVYSFGPNRRRDSSRWQLRGDDVGRIFTLPPGVESPNQKRADGRFPPARL